MGLSLFCIGLFVGDVMAWMAALARTAARVAVSSAMRSGGDSKDGVIGYVAFTDYRDLIKELRKIDPSYATRLRRDFKRIAKPIQASVSKVIPRRHPTSGVHVRGAKNVSGFKPIVVPGRLSWSANAQNGNVQPKHVTVRLTKQRSFKKLGTLGKISIVRVEVDNAAVVMADMAGRSKAYINKRPITREYPYSRSATGSRRHRIRNQGIGMINALNRGRNVQQAGASRWIWPTANQQLPMVQRQIDAAISDANRLINERMKTR